MLNKLIFSFNVLMIIGNNYAMEQQERIEYTLCEVMNNHVTPILCSPDTLLVSKELFNDKFKPFFNAVYDSFRFDVLLDKQNERRLLLFTTFEDALERLYTLNNLMYVNKRLYDHIKTNYQDTGTIKNQYKDIAFKLECYPIYHDIYGIIFNGYCHNQRPQIALGQLEIINNHSKTLRFFQCIRSYTGTDDYWDYSNKLGRLVNLLIYMHESRSWNVFKHTMYFRSATQYEVLLTNIIKNFIGTFTADTIITCECENYIANISSLLHPEITIVNNGLQAYSEYQYTFIKNEDQNSE